MVEQDISRFAGLIAGLGEAYDKMFTQAAIDIYWSVLIPFKFEEVKKAVCLYVGSPDGKYLPKPADIIMAIDGSSQNQALRAWTKAISAVHRAGSYTSVVFDDALIHAVIKDMGGWQRFCLGDDKQRPFTTKDFQERYRGYVMQKPTRYPKYLVGIIESQNSYNGYVCDLPMLIGDKEKAKQVFENGTYESTLEIEQLSVEASKAIANKAVSKRNNKAIYG